jgi:ATP-dependent helicase/nuclease subunit B
MTPLLDGPAPRVFGLPPGLPFATALAEGLAARLDGAPPEAWGRITLYLPARRMLRAVRDAIEARGPVLLPRLRLLPEVALDPAGAGLPPPVPALRRRLELARLVGALLEKEPDLAPRARLYDLADSLAQLMEEMQGEGVPPEAIRGLDVSDLSGHWERSLRFLQILEPWFGEAGAPEGEARLRQAAERLALAWEAAPPADPVIVAGATGAQGGARVLMEAVARLPQGAVVLPAFDFDLPRAIWDGLDSALTGEDHAQFRFACLLRRLDLAPEAVRPWTGRDAPVPARARLLSLALRPPPVTDQWLAEGPALGDLRPACEGLTLLEAPSPRLEAEAIAARMREGIARGETCALVTPDRTLTRRVAAALDRWGVVPDDSAGVPLALSPPGRLLRQVARLIGARATGADLLALLKHPLCHAGAGRGAHLRRVHSLELALRRRGPPFPDAAALGAFAEREAREGRADPGLAPWAAWAGGLLDRLAPGGVRPLPDLLRLHVETAEAASRGAEAAEGAGTLWDAAAGREARAACEELARHADAGGPLSPLDYAALFDGILAPREVRERDRGHPQALILGPREAAAQGADLVILAGLNDGAWPPAPRPDPWLNRRLRESAGLPLPEREIGLSALDFAAALNAREAWITRSTRSDDAPTTPSRWLVRLLNLVEGLPEEQGGQAALAEMRARGDRWLALAAALGRPGAAVPRARRPSPRPPREARPRRFSVTQFARLHRDPYAVYAETVLGLRPLDPLVPEADSRLRGTLLHGALEAAFRDGLDPDAPDARARLLDAAARAIAEGCAWPVQGRLWLEAFGALLDPFLEAERERRAQACPRHFELKGEIAVEAAGERFVLTGRADRVDVSGEGALRIYDYKSGEMPSAKQQGLFDKQLLLLAAMAERGAFGAIGPARVAGAAFLGIGSKPKSVAAPLDEHSPDRVWEELLRVLALWTDPARGYTARMAADPKQRDGDYDHLARFGEWSLDEDPVPEDLA